MMDCVKEYCLQKKRELQEIVKGPANKQAMPTHSSTNGALKSSD